MNNRWAWNLPVLSALAIGLASGTAAAQMAPPMAPMGGQFMDPATALAAQSQMAAQGQFAGQPPAGMYAPMPAAAYPPAAMYPAIQSAAYTGGPPAVVGAPPQMLGPGPGGPMPDAYGSYGSVPMNGGAPGYGQPGYDPQMYGGPMPGGMTGGPMSMDAGCPYCGGQGCEFCAGGGGHGHWPNGLLGDVLGLVAPYPDGGCAAVRWFDFAVDYMSLRRDNTGRNQVFTSLGTPAPGAAPNIVLQTNDLDFPNNRPGFRFQGALQVGPANAVEFTYFGQFSYTSAASVTDLNNNLFSVFTDFGRTPLGGLPEFDQTAFQQIRYNSAFDSFEVMWRQRWMAPNCRYQGSWAIGCRHFILDEKFRYSTSSNLNGQIVGNGFLPLTTQTDIDTTNNLTGLQLGTDLWICLLPGLRAGGELQAGVYGNHAGVNTTAGSNALPGTIFRERLVTNDVAFIGQANLQTTYRINYQWTARAGYHFLYVDGVALAPENFNTVPPNINNPFRPRVPLINDNGNVFSTLR